MTYPYDNLENFTLKSLIDRSVAFYPNEPALAKVGQDPMSYDDLRQNIQDTIIMLHDNGIKKGDKVAILSENMPNWGVAYLSVTYFGGVIVPILPDFHKSDVHHIIHHSEAKAIFVSDKHLSTVEELDDSRLHFVVKLDDLEIVTPLTNHSYISQIKQKLTSAKELSVPKEDDMAALLYTSGTTGNSKGVMLSHKNLATNALSTYSKIEIHPNDVFLSILPLAHTLECTVGFLVPLLHGSSVVYIDKVPTPSVLLKAFEVVKPTMMVSVPLIIEKIYKNKVLPKFTGSFIMRTLYSIPFFRKKLNKIAGKKLIETFGGRLRFFGIGGAGISPYVEKFLKEAEFPYIIGYGLTETAPLLAGTVLGSELKLKSTGTVFPYVEVKVKDPDDETGSGELLFKSPSLMMGYYKDEKQSAEVIDKDGWFHSGDLGYVDEDGYIFINGRSKNVIIGSGGENIFPEQIEATINQHEAVVDSLVMMRDDKLIVKVHLDYELIDKMFKAHNLPDSEVKTKINDLLEEMRIDVNTKVATYEKMVKFVEQIEPFIKTPTKKIKRFLYVE
ncbi:AMP-binding protein [Sulfurimonas sp. SAG-AH-194-C21]|nr:AMP-binding protein [Sulfurimonas sp. SAG-AH-194-C21]MDF1884329.1 AMP-binding protein [Sulfurimonas sp. SAG-AH-194-C21]